MPPSEIDQREKRQKTIRQIIEQADLQTAGFGEIEQPDLNTAKLGHVGNAALESLQARRLVDQRRLNAALSAWLTSKLSW